MNRYIGFLILTLLAFSCSNKSNDPLTIGYTQEKNRTAYNHKYELKEAELVSIDLDTTTRLSYASAQLGKAEDGKDYYSILNYIDNSITYYNLDTQKQAKIHYQLEGENGLGNIDMISAHYFSHPNKAYVYNAQTGFLYHIDSLGKVENKYEIVDYEGDGTVGFPQPEALHPIKIFEGDIYFSCVMGKMRANFSDYGMVLKYNLKTRVRKYILELPLIYNKAFWGSWFKYQSNFDFNTKENSLVVGHSINPFVFHADLDGKALQNPTYVGSEYIKKMEPMSLDINDGLKAKRDWDRERTYSATNSEFGKFIYDPYRNVYYRLLLLRLSLEQFTETGTRRPDFSIIVMNTKFEKVGEFKFDTEKYELSTLGITDKGIWLARRDLYEQNENQITFSVFDLIEK